MLAVVCLVEEMAEKMAEIIGREQIKSHAIGKKTLANN